MGVHGYPRRQLAALAALRLKAQLDVHAPFYDSRLEEIGDTALEATFGAWMQRRNDARLEFAIVEDLRVRTAPDVVFKISAHSSL